VGMASAVIDIELASWEDIVIPARYSRSRRGRNRVFLTSRGRTFIMPETIGMGTLGSVELCES
jgi:hypothetical protein